MITFHLVVANQTVKKGGGINYPIDVLPMGKDQRLLVVANRLPETNLRQVIENSISSIDPAETRLDDSDEDRTIDLFLTGFMLSTPVEVR